jgi:uncharacterized protein (TIGR00369 family)
MMTDDLDVLNMVQQRIPPFSKLLGIKFTSAAPDRVVAQMIVREDMLTTPAILHGGAIMAFADTLGAVATVLNLKPGFTTTTLESKTNFFAPAQVGTVITGECQPLHRGRRTMCWQTRISSENDRLVAVVTQTQMVLEIEPKK